MNNLYRLLIWLHPPSFRRRFGREMLWLYGEVGWEESRAGLLADALASLARQWLLRAGGWKLVPALCGGLLAPVLGLFLPSVLLARLDPRPSSYPYGFFLLATFAALFTICGTLSLSVLWFRMSSRRHA